MPRPDDKFEVVRVGRGIGGCEDVKIRRGIRGITIMAIAMIGRISRADEKF